MLESWLSNRSNYTYFLKLLQGNGMQALSLPCGCQPVMKIFY